MFYEDRDALRKMMEEKYRKDQIERNRELLGDRADQTFRFPETSAWTTGTRVFKARCGECTACCTAMPIHAKEGSTAEDYVARGQRESILKGAHVKCPYLEAGCSVYRGRPQVCQEYRCAWLKGTRGLALSRPDKSGLILDWEAGAILADPQYPYHPTGGHFVAWETEKGSLTDGPARETLNMLTLEHGYLVCAYLGDSGEQQLYCDPIGQRVLTETKPDGEGGFRYAIKYLRWNDYMEPCEDRKTWRFKLGSHLLERALVRLSVAK